MRSKARRWVIGLGIVVCTAAAAVVATPAPAHAACYTIQVGSDGITVCP